MRTSSATTTTRTSSRRRPRRRPRRPRPRRAPPPPRGSSRRLGPLGHALGLRRAPPLRARQQVAEPGGLAQPHPRGLRVGQREAAVAGPVGVLGTGAVVAPAAVALVV